MNHAEEARNPDLETVQVAEQLMETAHGDGTSCRRFVVSRECCVPKLASDIRP
jgi:hypothetical protein